MEEAYEESLSFNKAHKARRQIEIRSNFNSRGVDSREIGRFFVHNSEPVRS